MAVVSVSPAKSTIQIGMFSKVNYLVEPIDTEFFKKNHKIHSELKKHKDDKKNSSMNLKGTDAWVMPKNHIQHKAKKWLRQSKIWIPDSIQKNTKNNSIWNEDGDGKLNNWAFKFKGSLSK